MVSGKLASQPHVSSWLTTAGPLIGGIVNVQREHFDLIEAPVDLSKELAMSAIEGQLHVARSVYELCSAITSQQLKGEMSNSVVEKLRTHASSHFNTRP
jgi:hypothetical protein